MHSLTCCRTSGSLPCLRTGWRSCPIALSSIAFYGNRRRVKKPETVVSQWPASFCANRTSVNDVRLFDQHVKMFLVHKVKTSSEHDGNLLVKASQLASGSRTRTVYANVPELKESILHRAHVLRTAAASSNARLKDWPDQRTMWGGCGDDFYDDSSRVRRR